MVDQLKTNGAEILVVDDEPIVLNFTATLLRREGYAVAEADNGEEALFVFKQNQSSVKLLLTDVVMPETTGPELALDLLQLKPDLKILFMTACCDSLPNAYSFPLHPSGLQQRAGKLPENDMHGAAPRRPALGKCPASFYGARAVAS